jgi:hypothetical protein
MKKRYQIEQQRAVQQSRQLVSEQNPNIQINVYASEKVMFSMASAYSNNFEGGAEQYGHGCEKENRYAKCIHNPDRGSKGQTGTAICTHNIPKPKGSIAKVESFSRIVSFCESMAISGSLARDAGPKDTLGRPPHFRSKRRNPSSSEDTHPSPLLRYCCLVSQADSHLLAIRKGPARKPARSVSGAIFLEYELH